MVEFPRETSVYQSQQPTGETKTRLSPKRFHTYKFPLPQPPPAVIMLSRFCCQTVLRPTYRYQGFTLLELMVVMIIIALLVGYVAPNYFSVVGKSEAKAARAQLDGLQKALVAYRLDVGTYPPSDPGLTALIRKPIGASQWAGPYLSKAVPLDPWGHSYVYRYPGHNAEFDLFSYGRDGKPGGEGDAADISI